jgi:cytochrome P450
MHPVRQMFEFTFRPLEFLDECRAKYGDPFTVRMAGHGTFISLAAPELIKQAFSGSPEELHAGEANAILEPILGKNSVLLLDEKPHARQRQLLMPPLHGERMRAYAQLMVEVTRAELSTMPEGKAYSLHPYMQAITLEVILRAVVGADAGPQLDRLRQVLLQFLVIPPTVVTFIPVKYLDFPLSPYRAFRARRAQVDAQLDELIRERRGTAGTGRADVLSLLLDARDEAGQPMSDAELRDELLTMLMAGHETTATSLSWAFSNILSRPEVESKLRAEVETARGKDGALDVAAVHKLEYLDAVIKESLRLTPIVPDVVRKLTRPMMVAGYELPAGVNLMPTIWLAHRRQESWSEPQKFLPERFIKQKLDPNAWFPFGGGTRRCLGMAFALYEMKIVLAQLLLDAELKLSGKPPRAERRYITLAPTGGTRVVMTRRSA